MNKCECGCGELLAQGRSFKQGHDARHKSNLFRFATDEKNPRQGKAILEIEKRGWAKLYQKHLDVQRRKALAASTKEKKVRARSFKLPEGVNADEYAKAVAMLDERGVPSARLKRGEVRELLGSLVADAR